MDKTIDLRPKTPDLRKVPVGTTVITSKGFKFKLISRKKGKESWKDLTSKLTWRDREEKTYNHYEATEKFGDKLPTIEEFRIAEEHGFRDILPNTNGYFFWSASLSPNFSDFAQGFYGNNGGSGYGYRGNDSSVRCVGR